MLLPLDWAGIKPAWSSWPREEGRRLFQIRPPDLFFSWEIVNEEFWPALRAQASPASPIHRVKRAHPVLQTSLKKWRCSHDCSKGFDNSVGLHHLFPSTKCGMSLGNIFFNPPIPKHQTHSGPKKESECLRNIKPDFKIGIFVAKLVQCWVFATLEITGALLLCFLAPAFLLFSIPSTSNPGAHLQQKGNSCLTNPLLSSVVWPFFCVDVGVSCEHLLPDLWFQSFLIYQANKGYSWMKIRREMWW